MAVYRNPGRIVLCGLAAVALAGCSGGTRVPRRVAPGEAHLKIMTYNVNYGLEGDPDILRVLRESDCDAVFLQETTPGWEQVLRAELSGRFAHMAFKHWSGAGGLGILSRLPFEDRVLIEPPPDSWFPAWLVLLHSPIGDLQVLNVHLHPPIDQHGSVVSGYFTTSDLRLGEIKHFSAHLQEGLPTLVVGDFNEGRYGEAVRFLAAAGLQSGLPEFDPSRHTWRWQTSGVTITSQLDHIVYSPQLDPLKVWVLSAGSSDHLPVMGIFVRR